MADNFYGNYPLTVDPNGANAQLSNLNSTSLNQDLSFQVMGTPEYLMMGVNPSISVGQVWATTFTPSSGSPISFTYTAQTTNINTEAASIVAAMNANATFIARGYSAYTQAGQGANPLAPTDPWAFVVKGPAGISFTISVPVAPVYSSSYNVGYVDGPFFISASTAPNFKVKNMAVPTADYDAANKLYVDTLADRHLNSTQTVAPTVVATANAGTGSTATLSNATDVAGKINLNITADNLITGQMVTLTFHTAYAVAPIVVVQPTNSVTGALSPNIGIYVISTTTTFGIYFAGGGAEGEVAALQFAYHVIETA